MKKLTLMLLNVIYLFLMLVHSSIEAWIVREKNSREAFTHFEKKEPNSKGYLFNAWINSAALLFHWQRLAHTFSIHHTNSFVFFWQALFFLSNQQNTRNRQTQQIIPKQRTKLHVGHNLSLKLTLHWILSVSITTVSIFFICDIANFDCQTTHQLVVLYQSFSGKRKHSRNRAI